ncbi:MAG: biotin--[acetyl-CoA-carboxylase] ligase [Actinomycetota bacterium]|nr:biotin--[acetyl-CoA-carboxylase] ligase [Actinomycetota bacterium]
MRRFAEIDSTNRYLLDEARAGAPEGTVVVADHQSAGRGRLGRSWDAPAGSALLMSVLLRPALPPARLHLVTAAMALAAADACEAVSGVRPALKWPNDLVVGDPATGESKLAGVLAEAELPAVVVGLGLNLTRPPPGSRYGAVALSQVAGRSVEASALLDRLLANLGALAEDWEVASSRYRRSCATVGRPVLVTLGVDGESFTGTAVEVDGDGHLCVDTDGGVRTVSAADVVHLRPLSEPPGPAGR